MKKQQVWMNIHESIMPLKCRCMKSNGYSKLSANSVYQACLVACEYSQVSGVDCSENYSLVVNNITFHILLNGYLFGFLAKIVDVDISFLYGDLEEEFIYNVPIVCQT